MSLGTLVLSSLAAKGTPVTSPGVVTASLSRVGTIN